MRSRTQNYYIVYELVEEVRHFCGRSELSELLWWYIMKGYEIAVVGVCAWCVVRGGLFCLR